MEKFRLIIDGSSNAARNMACDETLFRSVIDGGSPPAMRFYHWDPPGLSVGYLQRIRKEVNLDMCREHGIDYVRRLTGGKAVLHDDELTYSLAIPVNHKKVRGRGVVDSYRTISEALVKGLTLCGIPCTMAPERSSRMKKSDTSVCFDTPSVYEVMANGKKIIGSAQTRDRGIILQHGSVPIDWDTEKLFDVTGIPREGREFYGEHFRGIATTVSNELGHRIEFEDLIPCFVRGFEDVFEVELVPSEYTDGEKRMAERFEREKYGSDEWNLLK